MEIKEASARPGMGKWGAFLERCGQDAGKGRVEAEAALEPPLRRALGSAPQMEGELQALFHQEEIGGMVAHDAATENDREKTGKVGQK